MFKSLDIRQRRTKIPKRQKHHEKSPVTAQVHCLESHRAMAQDENWGEGR